MPEGQKTARKALEKVVSKHTSILLPHTNVDIMQFDKYSLAVNGQISSPKCMQDNARKEINLSANSQTDGAVQYGSDRVKAAAQARRLREQNAPRAPREELQRFLDDPLAECDPSELDLVSWWGVRNTFSLLSQALISHVLAGERRSLSHNGKNCSRLPCDTRLISAV